MDLCQVTFRSFVVQWLAKISGCQPQLKALFMEINQPIKATLSAIKVTIFDGGNFDWSLIQHIFKKIDHHLWKRYKS